MRRGAKIVFWTTTPAPVQGTIVCEKTWRGQKRLVVKQDFPFSLVTEVLISERGITWCEDTPGAVKAMMVAHELAR